MINPKHCKISLDKLGFIDIDMTNEEINKDIAEYCGWKYEFNGNDEDPEWYWIPPNNPDGNGTPPDYCNDLNAMAEAKNLLTGDKRREFIEYLYEIVKQDKNINAGPYSVMIEAFYATAKQQAIAFVKTIGKWKD